MAGRFLPVAAALAALALVAAPAVADTTVPLLEVLSFDQGLGHQSDLNLDTQLIASSAAPESIGLTVPGGYTMATAVVGAQLGTVQADVQPAAGGTTGMLTGKIVAADPAALAASPQVQACAPGAHGAAWNLVLTGAATLTLPVAIDTLPAGGYRLTACFEAVRAAALNLSRIDLETTGVFTNPATMAKYVWSAVVTPFDAAGAPDRTTAFELRSDEPLPETLTLKPAIDRTKLLTLSGRLVAAAQPRSSIHVHLLAGKTPSTLTEIGVATTSSAGAYVFRHRFATPPRYVWANVYFYFVTSCAQPSTAPGGCASETTDGTASATTKVPPLPPQPKPKPKPKKTRG